MSGPGHNSAAYGQELRDEIETVLGDDHEKLFHFAKWHIEDYVQGTKGMALETEGAYIRFLMRLYRRGKPLPDDDRFMSIVMGLSIRVWKRIKGSLIAIGKIVLRSGCLTNMRFEKERKARAEQLKKQSEGMRKRWANERAAKEKNQEVSGKFQESLGEVSGKLSGKVGEKTNEINGTDDSQLPIERERTKKEERKKENKQPPNSESVAARGAGEVQGLNGATAHIVKTLGEWINPIIPDHKTAKGWLESSVSMYGGTVVRDSFAELEAKIMHGDIVGRPIPLLTKICQRRKSASTPPKKPNNSRRPRPWD